MPPPLRIGHGFDVHPFASDPDRPLVLGGVLVPDAPGLSGHSDADALTHALADALLGAAGLGDLGGRFPSSDPAWAGADSTVMLRMVMEWIRAEGCTVVNADCTIIGERPRLAAQIPAMAARLTGVVEAPVSVRAKRGEGLGALGRGEGVACLAVALLWVRS
jgi:2-C-methyl-D-erythritol 2,4-cyclodiphosphate synthase